MEHVWPDNHKELINQQVDRGIGFSDTTFYYRKLKLSNIFKRAKIINPVYQPSSRLKNSYKLFIVLLRTFMKSLKRIFYNGSILCFRACKFSSNGFRDYFGFLYTHNLTNISITSGEFVGVFNIFLRDILNQSKGSDTKS